MTLAPGATRGTSHVRVRSLHRCDLTDVVRLHRAEFPTSVHTRLGTLLLRAYFVTFITSPHAVAYAVERDGEMVGHLVGIVRLRAHRRRLLRRHLVRLVLSAGVGAVARPSLVVALLRARLGRRRLARDAPRGQRRPHGATGADPVVIAVLSHVAVHRDHRGHGLGAALVDRFEHEAFATGATRLCLATADDGSGAAAFYEGRGWTRTTRRTTFDERPISLYQLDHEGAPLCSEPAP